MGLEKTVVTKYCSPKFGLVEKAFRWLTHFSSGGGGKERWRFLKPSNPFSGVTLLMAGNVMVPRLLSIGKVNWWSTFMAVTRIGRR